MIDYYSGSALINCLISLVLGGLFLSKKSNYKGFAGYNLTLAFWSVSCIWLQRSNSAESARFFCVLLMIGAILAPRYYLISVLEIVNRSPRDLAWMRYLNNSAVALLIPLSFTHLMVHSFSPKLGFQFWPNAGPVFPIFLTYFFINAIVGFGLFYNAFKKTRSRQYLLILATALIAFGGGATHYCLWIDIPVPPYGNGLIVGYAIIVAIAISKLNILDISMAITRNMGWFLRVLILAIGYIILQLLLTINAGIDLPLLGYGATLVCLFGAFVVLWLQTEAQKTLLKGNHNYQTTLSRLVSHFSDSGNVSHFIQIVEHQVAFELKLEKVNLLVRSDLSNPSQSSSYFQSSDLSIRLDAGHPLLNQLDDPLGMIKLDPSSTQGLFFPGFLLVLPCRYQNQTLGIILVGKKLTEDRFSNDDMCLFPLLATQAGLALHRLKQLRFEAELKIAQKIQTELTPKRPSIQGVQIATRMLTASEMGGDYYDIRHTQMGDWIILGDVTGHGVESAMVMIMVQSIVTTLLQLNPAQQPSDLIAGINQSLMSTVTRLNDPRPMTIVALFTPDGRTFTYSGSHDPLLQVTEQACVWMDVDQFPVGVGVIDDADVFVGDNRTITLSPGDILYIGTDGVSEAAFKGTYANGLFGQDRIEAIVKSHATYDPDTIATALVSAVDQFTDETHHDDMTFLILKAYPF